MCRGTATVGREQRCETHIPRCFSSLGQMVTGLCGLEGSPLSRIVQSIPLDSLTNFEVSHIIGGRAN